MTADVTRSFVPAGLQYNQYKNYLRTDFCCSCAYCTMTEAEAQCRRFTIDHYEPRKARPDLENEYNNLMYSCDECNLRKSDRYPPPEARAAGHRFFRPDEDARREHFERSGILLKSKTAVGEFTIQFIDLNRLALQTIRKIRDRLTKCDAFVDEGVFGLKHFPLDQLPPVVRGQAFVLINRVESAAAKQVTKIDALLFEFAKSPLNDLDPDAEKRAQDSASKMKGLQALFPGNWRAPRARRGSKHSK